MTKTLAIFLGIMAFCFDAHAISCSSFASHAQAQHYFNAHRWVHKLDRDHDGSACDCLLEGSRMCGKKGHKRHGHHRHRRHHRHHRRHYG
ncbi:excalibur calcium-binding domain-containing protein [Crenothrix sp.]|uniref:excalibur calcium-binding domain-containing protein n=1 Tax=Crenothrix sp. TaxID=3100433 RepID=UPI00374D7119